MVGREGWEEGRKIGELLEREEFCPHVASWTPSSLGEEQERAEFLCFIVPCKAQSSSSSSSSSHGQHRLRLAQFDRKQSPTISLSKHFIKEAKA